MAQGKQSCVLLRVEGSKYYSRVYKFIEYVRYQVAAFGNADKHITSGQAIASAAKLHGAGLYCGPSSGLLERIHPVDYPTEATDILMAKAYMMMIKASTQPDWPSIDFKFTPELDEKFLAYANKQILSPPNPPLPKDSPEKVVTEILSFFHYNVPVSYTQGLIILEFSSLNLEDGFLRFSCGTKKDVKLFCLARTQALRSINASSWWFWVLVHSTNPFIKSLN